MKFDMCCLFRVMTQLNVATRNMIRKMKNLVLMFWIDMFSTIVAFFDLLCVLVEDHIRQKSLRATCFIDYYVVAMSLYILSHHVKN